MTMKEQIARARQAAQRRTHEREQAIIDAEVKRSPVMAEIEKARQAQQENEQKHNVQLEIPEAHREPDVPPCPVCGSTEPECEPGCSAIPKPRIPLFDSGDPELGNEISREFGSELEIPRPVECYDCGEPAKFRVVSVNTQDPTRIFNQVFCPDCAHEQGGGEITLL